MSNNEQAAAPPTVTFDPAAPVTIVVDVATAAVDDVAAQYRVPLEDWTDLAVQEDPVNDRFTATLPLVPRQTHVLVAIDLNLGGGLPYRARITLRQNGNDLGQPFPLHGVTPETGARSLQLEVVLA